jgi:hypothetical protein
MGAFLAALMSKGGSGGKSDNAGKVDSTTYAKGAGSTAAQPSSYHKGGRVRKSGVAVVKKGEVILTKAQQNKLRKQITVHEKSPLKKYPARKRG